ncbi:ribosome recycling factor [Bacillus sp. Marseille-Q3570]|uniref:ribosome recycling factor n=1 Tax=Bacillus sp. Marseille-Q3570 TaxID=2963522 RepID=UPI0021B72779|nr:ribosome recycling factor [Bacillus sp. Marseille-Q3570]
MSNTIIKQADEKMQKAVAAFRRELATLRAGRANPSLLDRVSVDYYGALTPLNQMANISVPEARLLVIQPYDKSIIGEIEKAIQKAELGLSPSNDGDVIRIAIPALTEERRKELVKLVKKYSEEGKVAVRNIRRDANDELKKLQKDGEMTEDDLRHYSDEVQKVTDRFVSEIDSIAENKEKEIMEV